MSESFENSLLRRQLKKHLGRTVTDADWLAFLKAVGDSYNQYEEDQNLLERALELSALELTRVKDSIQLVSDRQKAILDTRDAKKPAQSLDEHRQTWKKNLGSARHKQPGKQRSRQSRGRPKQRPGHAPEPC